MQDRRTTTTTLTTTALNTTPVASLTMDRDLSGLAVTVDYRLEADVAWQ